MSGVPYGIVGLEAKTQSVKTVCLKTYAAVAIARHPPLLFLPLEAFGVAQEISRFFQHALLAKPSCDTLAAVFIKKMTLSHESTNQWRLDPLGDVDLEVNDAGNFTEQQVASESVSPPSIDNKSTRSGPSLFHAEPLIRFPYLRIRVHAFFLFLESFWIVDIRIANSADRLVCCHRLFSSLSHSHTNAFGPLFVVLRH